MKPRQRALHLLCLGVFVLGCYAQAPTCGFVWDDHDDIERGRLIGSVRNIPRLFLHDTMYNTDGGVGAARRPINTYRPLTMTTFFLERAAFGLRPAAYHLDSLLLHLLCAGLVYAVGLELGLLHPTALLGAALFAVHPAPSEAVYWINGRSDPLCLLFFLLALWLWLRGLRPADPPAGPYALHRARGPVVAGLMLCAALCKETAFLLLPPLLLLLPALELRGRRALRALAPLLLGLSVGLLLRRLALSRLAVGLGTDHAVYALRRAPDLWLDGVRSLLVPTAQIQPSLYEHYRLVPAAHTAAAVLVLLSLLLLCAWRWRRGDPLALLALASLLSCLLPISMLTYIHSWSGWGRYLYAPWAFGALALAYGLGERAVAGRGPRAVRLALTAWTAILCALGAQTFAAGRSWHSERALILSQIADFPESAMGYSNLAALELEAGRPLEALVLLRRATQAAPEETAHWSRLAEALRRLGRIPEAVAAAREALRRHGGDNNARFIVAQASAASQPDLSARLFLEVLSEEPDQDGVWWELAQAVQRDRQRPAGLVPAVRARLAEPRFLAIAARARRILDGAAGGKPPP